MAQNWLKEDHIMWLGVVLVAIAAGISVPFLSPVIVIAGFVLLVNLFLIAKYPIWGLLAYLFVFLYRPGEVYPELAPLRIEMMLGVFLLVVLFVHQKIKTGKISLPADSITISLAVFLLVMLLTIFTSIEKTETLNACKEFLKILIFYFLIISLITNRKRFIAFIAVYCLMIGKIAFDAFKSYFSGSYVTTMGIDRIFGQTSAGGDPNSLAATMAITIPIVIASAIYFRNVISKTSLYVLGASMTILIAITGSRGGLLAFSGILLGGLIYTRHKSIAILAGVVLLVGSWFLLPDQYQDRYRTMVDVEDANETSSGRIVIWTAGVKMIADKPLLGIGAGAFAWATGRGNYGTRKYVQAHNLLIQLTATTGFIGLAVWLSFLFNFLTRLRKLARRARDDYKYRWVSLYSKAFVVSLIALFVAGLFGHNLYRYNWYMMAALTVAMTNIIQNKELLEEATGDESNNIDSIEATEKKLEA